MSFILFTLGFVVVVVGCMVLINRWMVSKRPNHNEPDDQP